MLIRHAAQGVFRDSLEVSRSTPRRQSTNTPIVVKASSDELAFMEQVVEKGVMSRAEREVLAPFFIPDARTLLALLQMAPSLSNQGFDFQRISSGIMRLGGRHRVAVQLAANASVDIEKRLRKDVLRFGPTASGIGDSKDRDGEPIRPRKGGKRLINGRSLPFADRAGWTVRNQGGRGTCASFAAVAMLEFGNCGGTCAEELSEQFLYWAAKKNATSSPPDKDGVYLDEIRTTLASHGVCLRKLCGYRDEYIQGNLAHTTIRNHRRRRSRQLAMFCADALTVGTTQRQ